MDGMVWIPGATFLMGSDDHYPEEAPAHKVTAGGFWMDAGPVTNREFGRFVRKHPDLKGYVTDVLIGDVFKEDVDVLWPLIDEMQAEQRAATGAKA